MRKFQCYVCGLLYDDYNEFKQHITSEHEEGREYLLCPLKHCRAPVRDLRAHFRTCHKGIVLPESVQMRATVFYDVREPKKIKRKVSFKEGYLLSHKNSMQKVHFRSSYEEQVYLCLENAGEVLRYLVEPIKIPYFLNGKRHNYYPDLVVHFADQKVEVWEIKPSNQSNLERNKAKWEAARYYCLLRGWKFIVITETLIQKLKQGIYFS